MKILLLGANGQLGFDLQRVFKSLDSSLNFLVPWTRSDLDIQNLPTIKDALSPVEFDVLINCTSYHKTDEVEDHATQAFLVNAHAVQEIAKVCAKKEALFIQISTDYVFDGRKGSAYLEEDPPFPINVYGASKAMGERLALLHHPKTIILRVASLFGLAGASGKGGNFVETMIRFGKEKGFLKVVDDQTMSPTSTLDIAKAIFTLIEKQAAPGIYHFVNSGQTTWFEFAKEIIHQSKVAAEVLPISSGEFTTKALRPAFSVLDNSKVSQIMGPIRNWKEALHEYLQEKGHL